MIKEMKYGEFIQYAMTKGIVKLRPFWNKHCGINIGKKKFFFLSKPLQIACNSGKTP